MSFIPVTSLETNVGATRRLLGAGRISVSLSWLGSLSFESSFSDSLAANISRFPKTEPLIELVALCEIPDIGVCGGVVMGRQGGWAEFTAVTEGTEPRVGVGLLITLEPGV